MRPSKREDIIRQALTVFEKRGFRGVGVNALAAECGVSKTSIYNNFGSKEGLAIAALRRRELAFETWLIRWVESRADSCEDQLLSLFDALADWCAQQGPHAGAPLVAPADHSGGESPLNRQAAAEKRALLAHIRVLCAQAAFARPDDVAAQIAVIFEGAHSAAATGVVSDPAEAGKRAAEAVIKSAERAPGWVSERAGPRRKDPSAR